jgi:DNA-binding response OmpR family regulator
MRNSPLAMREELGHVPRAMTTPRRASGEYVRPPVVVVLDDYVDTRELYVEYLNQLGFRAEGAADGEEAVQRVRAIRPAVIVIVLGLDGWAPVAPLREASTAALVVLTSTDGDDVDRRNAIAHGVAALLTKPCAPRLLAATIAALAQSGAPRRQLSS